MIIRNVGIIGLGRFGSLTANYLKYDFNVIAFDPNIKANHIKNGIRLTTLEEVCDCDLIIFSVPILHFESALIEAAPLFKKNSVVIDVLSVKLYSYQLMKKYLTDGVRILPTHPMFGPDSAKKGIEGLPIVVCPVDETSNDVFTLVEKYLSDKGLNVIVMSCDEHDKITANSLAITQMIGRLLGNMDIKSSDIDTQNFKNLLKMREIALNDSLELFLGLQTFNPYTEIMIKDFKQSFNAILDLISSNKSNNNIF